jgi:hypothetical protein
LIDQAIVDVDPPRVCPDKIPDELLEVRGSLEWVVPEDLEQLLGSWL